MNRLRGGWPYLLVLLAGAFVLLPRLGTFGLWDPWEPKYVESAQEMLERRSWFVPYYLDEVRLAKPILTYWGVIAGSVLFGFNELGARIGGVVMALASLAATYYVVARLRGTRAGIFAALVLATVPQFYFIARQATPDVYLFTTLGCALLFFALGLAEPGPRRDLHFGIAYAGFSLAVLAKGPLVAGAIFFVTIAVFAASQIDLSRFVEPPLRGPTLRLAATVVPALALLPLLAVSALWFGTSPAWWGYSREQRTEVAGLREELLRALDGAHAPEIVLWGLALAAAACLVGVLRPGPRRPARPGLVAAPLVTAALVSLAAAVAAPPAGRMLAASVLGAVGALVALVLAVRRFVRDSGLAAELRPWVLILRRQVLLFAGVFAVVGLPWHVIILALESRTFFTDFILYSNVKRASAEINSSGSLTFYMRTLVFGYFPWSCLLPAALLQLSGRRDRSAFGRQGFELFLLIACAVSFTAFTGAITKFPHYLSATAIPLAVLLGLTLERMLFQRFTARTQLAWIVSAMLYLLPLIDLLQQGYYRYLVETFTVKRAVPPRVEPGIYFTALVVSFAALLIASIAVRSRFLAGGLLTGALLLGNYCAAWFVPALSPYKTMKHLCETWTEHGAGPLALLGTEKHGTYFYTGRRIEHVASDPALLAFMHPREPAFAIVDRKKFEKLDQSYTLRHVGYRLHVLDASHLHLLLISNRPSPSEIDPRTLDLTGTADDD